VCEHQCGILVGGTLYNYEGIDKENNILMTLTLINKYPCLSGCCTRELIRSRSDDGTYFIRIRIYMYVYNLCGFWSKVINHRIMLFFIFSLILYSFYCRLAIKFCFHRCTICSELKLAYVLFNILYVYGFLFLTSGFIIYIYICYVHDLCIYIYILWTQFIQTFYACVSVSCVWLCGVCYYDDIGSRI